LPLLNVALELREGADDAIDDPIDFLHDLGEYLQARISGDDPPGGPQAAPAD
jgi:hypothetical protein